MTHVREVLFELADPAARLGKVSLVLGQGCTDLTELRPQLAGRALVVVMPMMLLGVVEVVVVALAGVVAAVVVAAPAYS